MFKVYLVNIIIKLVDIFYKPYKLYKPNKPYKQHLLLIEYDGRIH